MAHTGFDPDSFSFLFSQTNEVFTSLRVTVAFVICFTVISFCSRSALQQLFKRSRITTYSPWKVKMPRYIVGLRYLFNGPATLQNAYQNAAGTSFVITTPRCLHVLISSSALIQEFVESPPSQLSLHAVAKEMLQPKYTMQNFEWQDQRGIEGTGFVRALRSLLTANLPTLLPRLKEIIKQELQLETQLRMRADDISNVRIFPAVKNIIARANCFVFFGEQLLQNQEFVEAALQFPFDVIMAAELVRMTPAFLAPYVASLATRRHKAFKTMSSTLTPIVKKRLESRQDQDQRDKPVDCMQWLIDTSPRSNPWTVIRMVGEILAVWFSSVHQPAITATFALEDLCLFPEYVEPLRKELEMTQPLSVDRLSLLDSFLKESTRYSSVDAITCRRKVLTPFTFSNGLTVQVGDWLCVPQKAMMRDKRYHKEPAKFDGFRFLPNAHKDIKIETDAQDQNSGRFTDSSPDWLIWGFGKTVCPGRFYASNVIKLIITEVLEKYDCTLLGPQSSQVITWRSSTLPRSNTIMSFRKRLKDSRN